MANPQTIKTETRQNSKIIEDNERFLIVGYHDNLTWLESELVLLFDCIKAKMELSEISKTLKRPRHEIEYLLSYLRGSAEREDKQPLYDWSKRNFFLVKSKLL